MHATRPLFPLGRIVATPGALEALQNAGQDARELLARHAAGDWGACGARVCSQGRSVLVRYLLAHAALSGLLPCARQRAVVPASGTPVGPAPLRRESLCGRNTNMPQTGLMISSTTLRALLRVSSCSRTGRC